MHSLRWPLAALLSWALAWGLFALLAVVGVPAGLALAAGGFLGAALALLHAQRWRRLIVALGFPLSILMLGRVDATWAWLVPLGVLLLVYPLRSWSDAPLYPTPEGALEGLPGVVPLAPGSEVLDAGCGVGHGLAELARAYPEARLRGIEWSGLLARVARLLLRLRGVDAAVLQGDMWLLDWSGFALVYIFQRPESMAQAWAKARLEMLPGTHLASLDFEIPGEMPVARIELSGHHEVLVYKLGDWRADAAQQGA